MGACAVVTKTKSAGKKKIYLIPNTINVMILQTDKMSGIHKI